MPKVKMLKTAGYNTDGIGIKSTECRVGGIYDVPEWVVNTFVNNMGVAVLVKDEGIVEEVPEETPSNEIETPEPLELETKPEDLSDLETKKVSELKELAAEKGFVFEGEGNPKKQDYINFLNEVENGNS